MLLTAAAAILMTTAQPIQVMTFNIRYGTANDGENSWPHRREDALKLMSSHGIRHLPVVAEGTLQGVVNIRDLLEARSRAAEMTAEELSKYVYGAGYH